MNFNNIDLSMLFKGDMSSDEIHNMYNNDVSVMPIGKGSIIYLGSTTDKEEDTSDIIGNVINDSKRYFESTITS